jgi:hypothetical protein
MLGLGAGPIEQKIKCAAVVELLSNKKEERSQWCNYVEETKHMLTLFYDDDYRVFRRGEGATRQHMSWPNWVELWEVYFCFLLHLCILPIRLNTSVYT